jgi:hypothetical protein
MSHPNAGTSDRRSLPKKEGSSYAVGQGAETRPMPDYVERAMQRVGQRLGSAPRELPKRPRWPMLSGVFTFPFYLNTLGAWTYTSLGLMTAGWLLLFWLGPGMVLGLLSARLIGVPTCAAAVLTFGYAATCCLTIMEATSNGYDSIEISPGMDWKEWIWNYAHMAALVLEAALVGVVVRVVFPDESWLLPVAGTLAAFPLVLLGALAADGAWAPLAIGAVLRSVVWLPLEWGLFYVQTTGLAVVWLLVTAVGLGESPWVVPLYSGPFLAALILIYARLIGRLAGCIAAETLRHQTQGDDDEEP